MNSMTGFGAARGSHGSRDYALEVRAVNHRYLEVKLRLPSEFSALEERLAQKIRSLFGRGAFDVNLKCARAGDVLGLDPAQLEKLARWCDEAEKSWGRAITWSLEGLSKLGNINTLLPAAPSTEENAFILGLADKAIHDLAAFRKREGLSLEQSLLQRLESLKSLHAQALALAQEQPRQVKRRLEERLAQWNLPLENERLATEAALLADRADMSEELERLAAHLGELSKTLRDAGPIGRRVDFLAQELLRESNTIASKAVLADLALLCVNFKTECEKLREQAQNVE